MRQLQYHEKKLLKKVNLHVWKKEHKQRELEISRRYHIQERDDYKKYNKICGLITKLVNILKQLDSLDDRRINITDKLLDKLYMMGIIPHKKSLVQLEKLPTSAMIRRRLSVVMIQLKMAENIKEACTLIEQGHIKVGVETISDPSYHITRTMQDLVTWVDTSRVKKTIMKYNDNLDDYDLLN